MIFEPNINTMKTPEAEVTCPLPQFSVHLLKLPPPHFSNCLEELSNVWRTGLVAWNPSTGVLFLPCGHILSVNFKKLTHDPARCFERMCLQLKN